VTRELADRPRARADLDEIFWFVAADNPRRAATDLAEIQEACEALIETPMMGIARPDLRPEQVTPSHIDVLRVFSGGQDYEVIMGKD
jgi:toxin ParE1/3/4